MTVAFHATALITCSFNRGIRENWVRTDEADRLLAETLENGASNRHRLQEEELYRLKGESLLKTPHNEPDAEPYFLQAMEIARAQSAKWCGLCATVSLARMLAKARPAR